jgi:hypothetical protein
MVKKICDKNVVYILESIRYNLDYKQFIHYNDLDNSISTSLNFFELGFLYTCEE